MRGTASQMPAPKMHGLQQVKWSVFSVAEIFS